MSNSNFNFQILKEPKRFLKGQYEDAILQFFDEPAMRRAVQNLPIFDDPAREKLRLLLCDLLTLHRRRANARKCWKKVFAVS